LRRTRCTDLLLTVFVLLVLGLAGCERDAILADWEELRDADAPRRIDEEDLPALQTVDQRRPSTADMLSGFDDEPFRTAVVDAFTAYLSYTPDQVRSVPVTGSDATRNAWVSEYSVESVLETASMAKALLERMDSVDVDTLDSFDQVLYRTFAWVLRDRLLGQSFLEEGYSVNPMYPLNTGWTACDAFHLEEPFAAVDDCEDYLLRLRGVINQLEQIMDVLDRQEALGILIPLPIVVDLLSGELGEVTTCAVMESPRKSPLYRSFVEALTGLRGLEAATVNTYTILCEHILIEETYPAYCALGDRLYEMTAVSSGDVTLYGLPRGSEVYDWLLSHYTGLSVSATEVHTAALAVVELLLQQIRTVVDSLGGPADGTLETILQWAAETGGTVHWHNLRDRAAGLIESARVRVRDLFPSVTFESVSVEFSDSVSGYVPATENDGQSAFCVASRDPYPVYWLASKVFSEVFPGRDALYTAIDPRAETLFAETEDLFGFIDGWALYADGLAFENGFYDGDPLGVIGHHMTLLVAAATAAVDTGLHAMGWTASDAVAYFDEAVGRLAREVRFGLTASAPGATGGGTAYETGTYSIAPDVIERCIVAPGRWSAGFIGYRAFVRLREVATERLGDRFDLVAFHESLLRNGPLPLGVLDRVVDQHVAE